MVTKPSHSKYGKFDVFSVRGKVFREVQVAYSWQLPNLKSFLWLKTNYMDILNIVFKTVVLGFFLILLEETESTIARGKNSSNYEQISTEKMWQRIKRICKWSECIFIFQKFLIHDLLFTQFFKHRVWMFE